MRHITEFTEYKGGDIKTQVLYTSKVPLLLTGQVEFNIYGKAKINGISISDVTIRADMDDTEIALSAGAAIVFYQAPRLAKKLPDFVPVPDLPDYQDEATASIEAIVDQVLARRGIRNVPAEGADHYQDIDEGDEFDDMPEIPISQLSLVEEPAPDPGTDQMAEQDDYGDDNSGESGADQVDSVAAAQEDPPEPEEDFPADSKIAS